MRFFLMALVLGLFLTGCDDNRVYENYVDFEERYWLVKETPAFEFEVSDLTATYDLTGNVRNSVSYPWSRIFITYYLRDSLGAVLHKDLVSDFLFDAKTGKPSGSSGLGDIYDHEVPLLKNFRFKKAGKYSVTFEQFMRTDTLQGILAVGLRVDKTAP